MSDNVALGLVAGWDIDGGTIRLGQFYASLLTGAKSPESWCDFALETPLGRRVLLGPRAEQIAIGVAPSAHVGGEGVVVTTYSFYEHESLKRLEGAVYQRLAQERAARKLPPATSLPEMPFLEGQLALVESRKRNPQDVTALVLRHEVRRLQRPLGASMSLTVDLDQMHIANELLLPGPLAVRVGVATYKPEGSPWGYYLVYIIGTAPEE